jgi:hypothetical protein
VEPEQMKNCGETSGNAVEALLNRDSRLILGNGSLRWAFVLLLPQQMPLKV